MIDDCIIVILSMPIHAKKKGPQKPVTFGENVKYGGPGGQLLWVMSVGGFRCGRLFVTLLAHYQNNSISPITLDLYLVIPYAIRWTCMRPVKAETLVI